ncbi:hypothetical protein [Polaribacter sp. Hel1_85]|uniref:hypothetical protein n=1 Tax=Polaribacter sp. Hel1_85 TaxID=1250005 RepID=UPI00052CACF6|nr:hypothetical protein [Polaribacter sp. Hel1_85]KGL62926.1 hypothetical protein PHEL85_2722 [Polaribacter sp. Hel1_85]
MKKLTIIFIFLISVSSFISCESEEDKEWTCGTHNGKTLYTGPEGGCYYYNSNNNKTYVDRSECNNC